ncbi:MAG: tetratricopeptide repeat protein [Myxococcota bacterium]
MRTYLFVVWSITLWLLFPAEGHARMHAGAMASTMTPGYAITLEAPQKSWGLAVDFPALSDAESARVVVEAADNTLKRLAQAGGVDSVPAPDASVPTSVLEAEALYRWGLYAMSQGAFEQARLLFERVARDYGTSPSAVAAQERLAELALKPKTPVLTATPWDGRAAMMISQTLFGAAVGVLLPSYGSDGLTVQSSALFLLLGMGAGLGGGLLYAQEFAPSREQAAAIYFSQTFAALNLTMWTLGLGYELIPSDAYLRVTTTTLLLGMGLGTWAGAWISQHVKIPPGRVTLASSAALWTLGFGLSSMVLIGGDNLVGRAYLLMPPLLADVGLVSALLLADKFQINLSQDRMRVINLAGVVGGAAGFLLGAVFQVGDGRVVLGMTMAGAATGLLVGTGASEQWERSGKDSPVGARTPNHSVLVLEQGSIKLGQPMPSVALTRRPATLATEENVAQVAPTVRLSVLEGRF